VVFLVSRMLYSREVYVDNFCFFSFFFLWGLCLDFIFILGNLVSVSLSLDVDNYN
jgi:hypothetical protein